MVGPPALATVGGQGDGDEHTMHSVTGPGSVQVQVQVAERYSQAQVQVWLQAIGHRAGAGEYDALRASLALLIQVHSRVTGSKSVPSSLLAGPCRGRTGLDTMLSVPGGFNFTL